MDTTFVNPPLTHRFTALLRNGETIVQSPDDKPIIAREDGSGSAFTDVERRKDEVIAFFLESGTSADDPDKHLYLVDLRDGHFEIDGVPLRVGPDEEQVDAIRELVYFRRVARVQTTSAFGKVLGRATRRCYHLGYRLGERTVTIEVGHEVFHE
jgi:hypothetical protein